MMRLFLMATFATDKLLLKNNKEVSIIVYFVRERYIYFVFVKVVGSFCVCRNKIINECLFLTRNILLKFTNDSRDKPDGNRS